MSRRRSRMLAFGILLAFVILAPSRGEDPPRTGPESVWPGLKSSGAVLLPNGWSLKPAGRQTPLGDFPILVAECPTEAVLAVLHAGYGEHEVMTLNARDGKELGRVTIAETFGGLVWSSDGKTLFVGGGFDDVVYRFDHANGLLSNKVTLTGRGTADAGAGRAAVSEDFGLIRALRGSQPAKGCIAGLALSRDDATLWVADAYAQHLLRLDARTGTLQAEVDLGADSYPYGLAIDEAKDRAYVSLWGKAEVAAVDTKKHECVERWQTGAHPNEMRLARDGSLLYVANANRNTVTVHQTAEQGKALETIGTAISPDAPDGCTPNALALSADESILYVANANTNDVAVVNVVEPGHSKPLGLIPVGWYPTCVRISRDGNTLYVTNGKGSTSKANRDGPNPIIRTNSVREYIGGLLHGTLSLVRTPTPKQMGDYTKTVYECSPLNRDNPRAVASGRPDDSPIPAKVGDPSPIKHCIYVIKENRTYDQVFGDVAEGQGDPSLCLFPAKITPNHHALARDFVLLDNFYVESEVSADGHEWTMGAYATDFVERTWPISYRGEKRAPYPSEGSVPIAYPSSGYLWDRARAAGLSYISFGEFASSPNGDKPAIGKIESLKDHVDPKFDTFDLDVPDQKRADRFLEVLAEWTRAGEMPRLITLRLPNDHTSGTRTGKPTPTAFLADNDLALGRIVEGLSKSPFWPELAMFVVEDDAQNGSDHIDAHRTVALAISPYIRRGTVDSTLYSTSSMLRTMELILGLEPMTQFDAAARPMWAAFGAKPDPTSYQARPAGTDLGESNTSSAWGAQKSLQLDLTKEDAADDLVLNEIIWKAVRGADSPMPPPVRAAFVLPRIQAEEDDGD